MESSASTTRQNTQKRLQRTRRERLLIVFTVLLIITAWVVGYFRTDTDALSEAYEVIPGAERIDLRRDLYIGQTADRSEVVGYAAVGEAPGYGGPIKVIVGMDPDGNVLGIKIIENRETPGFFRLIDSSGYLAQFSRRTVSDPMQIGRDIDGISGATLSAEGVAAATRRAVDEIAASGLQTDRPTVVRSIKFGWPEITLLALFAVAYVGHKRKNSQLKRRLRGLTLWTGMIVLGFIYTAPLTISQIIALLSGYWPDWHNNLYWYLLIGGILFVTTVDAKNPYCAWFCPFGAFQETLAQISGARLHRPRQWRTALTWLPRILALTAIVLGLVLRQPGVAGYEPFATLFDLRGSALEWGLLIITILTSLMLYRPFCNFICPIDPVVDFIGTTRRLLRNGWQQWRTKTPPQ